MYSRRCSPGGVIMSQTTLCRNFGGKEGGPTFEGGVLAGHYSIIITALLRGIAMTDLSKNIKNWMTETI